MEIKTSYPSKIDLKEEQWLLGTGIAGDWVGRWGWKKGGYIWLMDGNVTLNSIKMYNQYVLIKKLPKWIKHEVLYMQKMNKILLHNKGQCLF
jgi:hypothetical protein